MKKKYLDYLLRSVKIILRNCSTYQSFVTKKTNVPRCPEPWIGIQFSEEIARVYKFYTQNNVSFLNGKSVTRVKSVYRVVKCFSMSDPLAPRVDLGCLSLRGPSKIHKWCQWITSGKTFHYSVN